MINPQTKAELMAQPDPVAIVIGYGSQLAKETATSEPKPIVTPGEKTPCPKE